jgi:divalent metal cation (Fe/Co/Zn/Cd) transporter
MLGPVQWMLSGVCQRKSIAPGIAFLGQSGVTSSSPAALDVALLRRGRLLEWFTLGWNVVGVLVLAMLAVTASSVALAGFGLDSFIEIGASALVLWELSGTGEVRQRRALRLIGVAFVLLGVYLLVQSVVALVSAHHASPSVGGILWTAVTAIVMFALAALKGRTGRALGNPVLVTEGRVTFIDGLLATAVLLGITLDLVLGWWWADPVAGLVIVYYAIREAVHIFHGESS